MRKGFYFFLVAVLICALSLTGCFSPWKGDEGNLVIVWGSSGRTRNFVDESELQDFIYTVKLTGPGGVIEQEFSGVPSAVFSVIPGIWNVSIRGSQIGNIRELRVMGIGQVTVKAGQKSREEINIYSAQEASDWWELSSLANDGRFPSGIAREYLIVIKNSLVTDIAYPSSLGTINISRKIILVAERPVTITRGSGFDGSFFSVYDPGKLTLGLPGMNGTITFDGENSGYNSAFIVGAPGELVMFDGVTIKHNIVRSGGGAVFIGQPDGIFTMNGGMISGNTAGDGSTTGRGGAVYNYGVFTMNGGTISGNAALSGNESAGRGGGVYNENTFTMKGGTISGNTALNNTAADGQGGGVFSLSYAFFDKSGGTISGNSPDNVYKEVP